MAKRKASLGLSELVEDKDIDANKAENPTYKEEQRATENTKRSKKNMIPFYVDPKLHEALHTIVFSERHKKTSFQTLLTDGLDLLLKKKGLPSIEEITSGKKTVNL